RATAEAGAAGRIASFLEGMFALADPGNARGPTTTAREILDLGARRVTAELKDQPLYQAALMESIGNVYRSLALYDEAQPLLEGAAGIRRSKAPLAERDPLVA